MVKIISDHLSKTIEYESRLNSLKVEGDNLIRYFQENSSANEDRKQKLLELKEEVINGKSPIKSFYRESILDEIQLYLDNLDGRTNGNNPGYDIFRDIILPLIIGLATGYTVNVEAERFVDRSTKRLAYSILEEISKYQKGETSGSIR